MNKQTLGNSSEMIITNEAVQRFVRHMRSEERSEATIEKYQHDIHQFVGWANDKAVTKDLATEWKSQLLTKGYAASTINCKLAALNAFFSFMGWDNCHVKALKQQRRLFREQSRELTKKEYDILVKTAQNMGKKRMALLMECICSTGIRVSEVKYITVEAAKNGKALISLKGKIRTILIPKSLSYKLLQYAQKQKIVSGEIFLTRNGTILSRKQIWAEMKAVCKEAGIEQSKVFPHNLRHLFARCFYHACRDIARLADVLGHSSIETTRIYLISTGSEHARTLEKLGLVS